MQKMISNNYKSTPSYYYIFKSTAFTRSDEGPTLEAGTKMIVFPSKVFLYNLGFSEACGLLSFQGYGGCEVEFENEYWCVFKDSHGFSLALSRSQYDFIEYNEALIQMKSILPVSRKWKTRKWVRRLLKGIKNLEKNHNQNTQNIYNKERN